jgi:hypothetical protein
MPGNTKRRRNASVLIDEETIDKLLDELCRNDERTQARQPPAICDTVRESDEVKTQTDGEARPAHAMQVAGGEALAPAYIDPLMDPEARALSLQILDDYLRRHAVGAGESE